MNMSLRCPGAISSKRRAIIGPVAEPSTRIPLDSISLDGGIPAVSSPGRIFDLPLTRRQATGFPLPLQSAYLIGSEPPGRSNHEFATIQHSRYIR